MATWQISGEYMETCNCAFLCPCIASNLTARPTEGDCKAAVAMRIDKGAKDGVTLDGLSFIVMMHSPGAMGEGNMTVGLIIDERAPTQQVEAIKRDRHRRGWRADGGTGAAGGQHCGRRAAADPVRMGWAESRSARGRLVDQACEGLPSAAAPGEAIAMDNMAHPVNTRLSLAKATRSRFNVFGMHWNDSSGTRNGHFAPFAWSA